MAKAYFLDLWERVPLRPLPKVDGAFQHRLFDEQGKTVHWAKQLRNIENVAIGCLQGLLQNGI